MNEISGVCQAHLISLVSTGAKEIHPVLAVDLFRYDGAGFRPADVPVSPVRRQDHTLALPVNEISRTGQAELCVLLVVTGVSEIVRVSHSD